MKLTFLGTGTSQGIPVIGCKCKVCQSADPRDKRFRTAALLEKDGVNIALDTGPDFRIQMLNAGIDHLEGVLMTHYHNDHIAGLDDVRPFNFMQKSYMQIYADEDTSEVIKKKYDYIFADDPYPGSPRVELTNHHFDEFVLPPFKVRPFKIWHGKMPITAYQINGLVYITDGKTIPDREMPKIMDCDVLVINALRRKEHHSHFNLEQAIEMSEKINARHTYLLHISHHLGLHEEVAKELPANVFLAYDGLKLDI